MTDYGRPVRFGLNVDPNVDLLPAARRLAAAADTAGLDLLGVQDHPYQPGHLDAWMLLGDLAHRTERISLFTDVSDLQLRPPTMLAKAAASLSVQTGGRIQLGVGGGAFPDAIAAMGATPRQGAAMVRYTEESLQILRQALTGGEVRLRGPGQGDGGGEHRVVGYRAGPVPPAPVEIWLGSRGPRMLALTGRAGDGWVCPLNIYVAPEDVPQRHQVIDDAARAAGRDPAQVRRIYNVLGTIGAGAGGPGLRGTAAQWTDTLTDWALQLGFDTFVFWPAGDQERQATAFAAEVVPEVRRRVKDARGG
jgi:alkanesulfonate monooxygenase SsuD/methylene tetrahydromethanopterin reductase-like flavin-dependent oxidoreductase (luciferase family)